MPARSPNLNAFAERFIKTIKSECLRQFVPLSERHLRQAIIEFTLHYHMERNHQGLGNLLIEPPVPPVNENAPVTIDMRISQEP